MTVETSEKQWPQVQSPIELPEKKYAVYPSEVRSKTDRQVHYVRAGDLIKLYKVNPHECIVVHKHFYDEPSLHKGLIERAEKLIALRPSYDGDYTLPKEEQDSSHPVNLAFE